MSKMTCGRTGNHFPHPEPRVFPSSARDIGMRENIIETPGGSESVDPEVYCRQYKSQLNRIPPFVILIPVMGLWLLLEPFGPP